MKHTIDDLVVGLRDELIGEKLPLHTKILAPLCLHSGSYIDVRARAVSCQKCGVQLDPFEVLDKIAREADWVLALRRERHDLATEVDALKVEVRKLKAQKKRAAT